MNRTEVKLKSTQHHLVWGEVAKFRFEHFLTIYLNALELEVKAGKNSLTIWDKCCPNWLTPFLTLADKARLQFRQKVTLSYSKNGTGLCLTEDYEYETKENGLNGLRIEFDPKPLVIKSVFLTYQ